ncbi:hypothetical protein [Dysgonomonas sp. Marseille-P4361]|uniref:EF-Tu C-terminal domain-related protein n=1 Tax=Dysgonomonas sp. Marseille-P4361 TaxID=2161820 RepID=UPI001612A5CF|nr:hypothetical protein [Dysgonomonas sp. Marseille-P4361]
MTAEEFVKNFYLERKNLIETSFDFESDMQRRSYVSAKLEEMNLDREQMEKLRHILSSLLTDSFYTILLGLDGSASIGDAQTNYKIYDDKDNLISDCGEIETEAYEYFHENKYEVENSKADFIATLKYRTTEEGGRKTPAHSGYRPQIRFDFEEMQTSGQQIFIDRNIVFPGDTVNAEIEIISTELFENRLKEGMPFEFREGGTVIGTGKIKHIVNKKLQQNSR